MNTSYNNNAENNTSQIHIRGVENVVKNDKNRARALAAAPVFSVIGERTPAKTTHDYLPDVANARLSDPSPEYGSVDSTNPTKQNSRDIKISKLNIKERAQFYASIHREHSADRRERGHTSPCPCYFCVLTNFWYSNGLDWYKSRIPFPILGSKPRTTLDTPLTVSNSYRTTYAKPHSGLSSAKHSSNNRTKPRTVPPSDSGAGEFSPYVL